MKTYIHLITRDGDLICSNVTNIRCFSLEKGEISVKGAKKPASGDSESGSALIIYIVIFIK